MRVALVLLLGVTLTERAWARGGGGCLEEGTRILTLKGKIAVEQLHRGDTILTISAGTLQRATVQGRVEVHPEAYLELNVGGRTLRVTRDHPLAVGDDEFRLASHLRPCDSVCLWDGQRSQQSVLLSVTRVPAGRPAYNLLVAPHGTFLADGILVHNKGCFLPETPLLRADGSTIAISAVKPGDRLRAFDTDGAVVVTTVRQVFTHEADEFVIVRTEQAVLRVTADHPFYVGDGTFKTLKSLKLGDNVIAFDGQKLDAQRITGLERVPSHVRGL